MKPNTPIEDIQKLFKIFSDKTRLKIIDALMEGPLCVQSLVEYLNLNQSAISHQLKLLREQNVVTFERNGKRIYYSLKDAHVIKIYKMARDHINECD